VPQVCQTLIANEPCSQLTYLSGRNGGHLTPTAFNGFRARQAKYGVQEALRSYELEKYTAQKLIEIAKGGAPEFKHLGEEDITDLNHAVDLLENGHIALFMKRGEEESARADWKAARASGMKFKDGDVRWFTKQEMLAVC